MSRILAAALAVAVTLPLGAEATAQGALKLDNMTFDKMVNLPGYTVLAKIDKSYAYGEKEDAFKELCKISHAVPNFFIGEVPVQEYGDKENEDVANRYNVKSEEFPTYLLFKGSTEKPAKFTGFPDPGAKKPTTWDDDEDGEWEAPMIEDPSAENLVTWLRKEGVKVPSIGTIAELDEVVEKFMKNGLSAADLATAKKIAEEEYKSDKKAPVYIKIMEKVKEKGADYVEKELTRVQRVMAGKITPEKEAELKEKVKILNVFTQ